MTVNQRVAGSSPAGGAGNQKVISLKACNLFYLQSICNHILSLLLLHALIYVKNFFNITKLLYLIKKGQGKYVYSFLQNFLAF
jgi:hypothetical protein